MPNPVVIHERIVMVPVGAVTLEGNLTVPEGAKGVVLFAHGSGSSRHSPRNRHVADVLREGGLATLLIDLLSVSEEEVDIYTRHLRFDIPMLADRLVSAIEWLRRQAETERLKIGLFGASTGAGAALAAAAARPDAVGAVVSRGGRPDLAADALEHVKAPTLMIVGSRDTEVLELNRRALDRMNCETRLEVIKGASHLFEEPGTLDQVARLARDWCARHLT